MSTVIAVANEKGGTGKTTMAVNLAAALGLRNKKTLLIDMDPQGNSSYVLGKPEDDEPAMYAVLTEKETAIDTVVRQCSTKNLSVAPSNLHLAGAEVQLASVLGRENILKRKITNGMREHYDFIILDTSPSLGLLTINALNAADYVLVPVSCDFLSMVGLSLLFDTIKLCQDQLGAQVRILGLVANRYDRRERISEEVLQTLKREFSGLLFETIIRVNVRLKESPLYHQTIYEYSPTCPGAKDHLALANELLKKVPA